MDVPETVPNGYQELYGYTLLSNEVSFRSKIVKIAMANGRERRNEKLIMEPKVKREVAERYMEQGANLITSEVCQKINLMDLDDRPLPRGPDIGPGVPPCNEGAKKVLEKYVEIYKDPLPLVAAEESRITGGNVNGILTALGEMARPLHPVRVDPSLLTASLLLVDETRGYRGPVLNPPPFHPGFEAAIPFDDSTSAGYVPAEYVMAQYGDTKVEVKGRVKKGAAHTRDRQILDLLYYRLKRSYEDPQQEKPIFEIFPYPISTPSAKQEPQAATFIPGKLGPEREFPGGVPRSTEGTFELSEAAAKKNRIFMIEPSPIQKVQKWMFGPIIAETRKKGANTHGISWEEGDAQLLYNSMSHLGYHADGDVSRIDQSLAAILLGAYVAKGIRYYRLERGTFEFYWVRKVFILLTAVAMYHLVQWPDRSWRFIIGMMMSGGYWTADGDDKVFEQQAFCSIIATACRTGNQKKAFLYFLALSGQARRIQYVRARKMIMCSQLFLATNGDDFLLSSSGWIKLKDFVWNLSEMFGMTVKWSNCNETTRVTTRQHNGLPYYHTYVAPDASEHVKPEGVTYLRHLFLEVVDRRGNKRGIVPWRPKTDYYHRAVMTVTDMEDPLVFLVRLHGLMLTTRGTNFEAYNYFYRLADILCDMYPSLEEKLWETDPIVLMKRDKELAKKIGYVALQRYVDNRGRPDGVELLTNMVEKSRGKLHEDWLSNSYRGGNSVFDFELI